jgi:hypothetical protein
MPHMSRIKYAVDSKHTRPWVDRVGKLIINFSVVEFECVHWLLQMSEDSSSFKKFTEMQFAARARCVMDLVDARKSSAAWRKRALRSWNQSLVLAKLRNRVAHNPVVFAWTRGTEAGEPDLIGVPILRSGGSQKSEILLSIGSADKAINEMAAVAKQLQQLREEWCSARDKGQVAAAPSTVRRAARIWQQVAERLRRAIRLAST